jgi:hypothetical protein
MTDALNDFNQQIMDEFRANAGKVGSVATSKADR